MVLSGIGPRAVFIAISFVLGASCCATADIGSSKAGQAALVAAKPLLKNAQKTAIPPDGAELDASYHGVPISYSYSVGSKGVVTFEYLIYKGKTRGPLLLPGDAPSKDLIAKTLSPAEIADFEKAHVVTTVTNAVAQSKRSYYLGAKFAFASTHDPGFNSNFVELDIFPKTELTKAIASERACAKIGCVR